MTSAVYLDACQNRFVYVYQQYGLGPGQTTPDKEMTWFVKWGSMYRAQVMNAPDGWTPSTGPGHNISADNSYAATGTVLDIDLGSVRPSDDALERPLANGDVVVTERTTLAQAEADYQKAGGKP